MAWAVRYVSMSSDRRRADEANRRADEANRRVDEERRAWREVLDHEQQRAAEERRELREALAYERQRANEMADEIRKFLPRIAALSEQIAPDRPSQPNLPAPEPDDANVRSDD